MRDRTVHAVGRAYLPAHRVILTARGLAGASSTWSATEVAPDADPLGVHSVLPVVVPGDHRCLTRPVDRLGAAIDAARRDYRAAVGPAGRDDLDLAA